MIRICPGFRTFRPETDFVLIIELQQEKQLFTTNSNNKTQFHNISNKNHIYNSALSLLGFFSYKIKP